MNDTRNTLDIYQIDAAQLDDIEPVLAIEQQTNPHNPWSNKTFIESMQQSNYHFWVLKHHGRVCGFCVISVVGDVFDGVSGAGVSGMPYNREAQLQSIAIRPAEQGKGLGRMLLDYVVDVSRVLGVKYMFLEVRESNHLAQKLYETTNFEYLGIRKNYYPLKIDGISAFEHAKAYRLTL